MADVTINITIPDAKVAKVRDGFLKMRPIPQIGGVDQYTARQWITECCADYIQRIAKAGLQELAKDAVTDDVTVTR